MGNKLETSSNEIEQDLQRTYQIGNYPHLIEKSTGLHCLVHKIVVGDYQQSQQILNNIKEYQRTKCKAVQTLKEYRHIDHSQSYCCQEDAYYLIFQGTDHHTLADVCQTRIKMQQSIHSRDINNLLQAGISAIREYHFRFQRKHDDLSMRDIKIDEKTTKISLKDPWLSSGNNKKKLNNTEIYKKNVQQYPSPEKLFCTHYARTQKYDEFLSDLFSLGAIGLAMSNIPRKESIYGKKQLYYEKIRNQLKQINDPDLQKNLSILLSQNPQERKKIFTKWQIQSQQNYYFSTYYSNTPEKTAYRAIQYVPEPFKRKDFDCSLVSFDIQRSKVNQNNHNNYNNQINSTSFLSQPNKVFRKDFSIRGSQINQNQNIIQHKKQKSQSIKFVTQPQQPPQQLWQSQKPQQLQQLHSQQINQPQQKLQQWPELKQIQYDIYKQPIPTLNIASKMNQGSQSNQNRRVNSERPIHNFEKTISTYHQNMTNNQPKKISSFRKNYDNKFQIEQSNCHNKAKINYPKQIRNEKHIIPEFIINNMNKNKNFDKDQLSQSFIKYSERNSESKLQRKQNLKKQKIDINDSKDKNNLYLNKQQQLFPKKKELSINLSDFNEQMKQLKKYDEIANKQIEKTNHEIKKIDELTKEQKEKNIQQILIDYGSYHPRQVVSYSIPVENNNHDVAGNNTQLIDKLSISLDKPEDKQFYSKISQVEENQKKQLVLYDYKIHKQDTNRNTSHQNKDFINDQNKIDTNNYVYNSDFTDYSGYKNENTLMSEFKQFQNFKNINVNIEEQDVQENIKDSLIRGVSDLQKQSKQTVKVNTPLRPTNKAKYNSTILEVKDEDTPENSSENNSLRQDEYVVEEYETGSRYQGFKSNGMRNGRGKFFYQDGGYYQGLWKDNKMDGWGKLYYQGGRLAYEGNWHQDQFHGFGKVYNDSPSEFKQCFDFTNFDLLDNYWQYYQGMLVCDTKEGRGKIKLSNGEMFQGDFQKDKIKGFGKFYTLDNKIIEGIWRDSHLTKIFS